MCHSTTDKTACDATIYTGINRKYMTMFHHNNLDFSTVLVLSLR